MSRRLLIALVLAATASPTASAQPTDSPWARGVSEARKQRARELLDRGNAALLASRPREAVTFYEQALAAWDHPGIRVNLVKALIALDKIVPAAEHLERALAYGAAPLDDQVYQEALNYQRLLRTQTGTIALSCEQAGVAIKLDGAEALRCPGRREVRALPGSHVVVATGAGLLTLSRDVVVNGGARLDVPVRLQTLAEGQRRWPAWLPWTVAGAGGVVAGVGLGFNLAARRADDELAERVARECSVQGCAPDRYRELGLAALEDTVQTRNRVSLIAIGVGGALVIAGGVMSLVNRRPLREVPAVSVIPAGDGVGLAVGGGF